MGCKVQSGAMRLVAGVALAVQCLGSSAALADITYIVDQTVGSGGVTGIITTDGTLGTLLPSDILSWNLELTGNGASLDLTNLNSIVYGAGSDVFATTREITFNYDATDGGYLVFQEPAGVGLGYYYWCNSTSTAYQNTCLTGISVVPHFYTDSSAQFATPSGTQVLATAPEPSSWVLMLLGFGGLAFAARQAGKGKLVPKRA
jgi:PEP-CTERM motif